MWLLAVFGWPRALVGHKLQPALACNSMGVQVLLAHLDAYPHFRSAHPHAAADRALRQEEAAPALFQPQLTVLPSANTPKQWPSPAATCGPEHMPGTQARAFV